MSTEDFVTLPPNFDMYVESISVVRVTRYVAQTTLRVFNRGVVVVQDPPAVLEARNLRKYVL
jgi:hypothetical protein